MVIMKGIICFVRTIGALLYAMLFSVIVTFLMKWITYVVISHGWIGDVLFLLFSGTVVATCLALLVAVLSIPLLKMTRDSKMAKSLCSILIAGNGYGILKSIWKIALQYGTAEIVGALLCSLFIFHLYKSFVVNIWLYGRNRRKVWDD